ncbi:HesB/IscA family protein [Fretibacter rubidus]|uniref:HesB/IscA family protein n=1 Tax=Fretibacter rubidus TaxID=570162 RepID=UPI00352A3CD6
MTETTTTPTRTRRPRPKLVTLTDAAAARVREILDERGEGYLRVGVKNGGCAGMEYIMDYVSEIAPFDEVVDDKDVQIVVDSKAVLFILGSVVDYEVDILSSRFTFKNPNQTDACGCGESVTILPFED